nr:MAG TPA: hypothetical protein [Caudoviricetes sp.]
MAGLANALKSPIGNHYLNRLSTKTHLQPIKSPLTPLYKRGGNG